MKPTTTLLVLASLLVPAAASAQGYYGRGGGPGPGYYAPPPPPPLAGGFHNRMGRLAYGFSLGLGNMANSGGDIECVNCDYSPLAGEGSFHIGGFVGPRMAILGEGQVNVQTLANDSLTGDTTTLTQAALMLAVQYWATPQLWLKGGLGLASLQVDRSYYGDGIVDASSVPENGGAVLLGIGYELLSARTFSVDIQGRILVGSYDGINDQITATSIGVGINWF